MLVYSEDNDKLWLLLKVESARLQELCRDVQAQHEDTPRYKRILYKYHCQKYALRITIGIPGTIGFLRLRADTIV